MMECWNGGKMTIAKLKALYVREISSLVVDYFKTQPSDIPSLHYSNRVVVRAQA
jgi:hypothetical protein